MRVLHQVREVPLLRLPRLPPRLLELLVQFPDREVELTELPGLARQFLFEALDASCELFELQEVRRRSRGNAAARGAGRSVSASTQSAAAIVILINPFLISFSS